MCSLARLLRPKARSLDRLVQQRLVLAGQAVAAAERVEAVGELVLVDHGRERAGLLEPVGWRHHHATFRAQPAEIIDSVMGDDADVGCDQILEPAIDPIGIEIVGVGMAQRNVDRSDLAVRAPGDADAAT